MNKALEPQAAATIGNPRYLVTGSSGFIGTHLVERILNSGAKVIGLDLKPPRKISPGLTYIAGDVRDLSHLNVGRIDAIYNFAAVHTTPGHEDAEYYDTNVNGALEVTRFAAQENIREIIFTSSISIYGPSEERKIETTTPAPVSAYGKSKLMAEKIHESWLNGAPGRKLTIVRPAVVFGSGEGGNFARMAKLLSKGIFVFPGRRDTIKSCIYVEDLLELILAAQIDPSNYNIFNGSYEECPTLEEIVINLRDNYFKRARLVDVPLGMVMSGARMLSGLSGIGLGVHPDRVLKLVRSTYIYPEWAVRRNLSSSQTLASGIARWAASTSNQFN